MAHPRLIAFRRWIYYHTPSVYSRSVYWVLRFNAGRLIDGRAPGRSHKLNLAQCEAPARIIENGPIPAIHGVVRWRLIDEAQMDLGVIPHQGSYHRPPY